MRASPTPRAALCAAVLALLPSLSAIAHAATPLKTVRVAGGLAQPLFVTAPPGDLDRTFVLEQWTGRIRLIKNGTLVANPFFTVHGLSSGDEQGLLGLAFHPQFSQNGYFYVDYTDATGRTNLRRYTVSGANPDRGDSTTGVTILTIEQPQANHNGGWIAFGPDGYLYIGSGDGGNFNDQGAGHDFNIGNGQSDTTRLGKILRIDVDHGAPFSIPADNPFAGSPAPKNEFWAKGTRNPWRCAFDRANGDLYIADVGQNLWEEIDYQPAGAGGRNYGWRKFEGYPVFNCPGPCDSSGLTRPAYSYSHGGNPLRCSITGGYVYRGPAIPDLQGSYFFADYCSNQIWSGKIAGGFLAQVTDRTTELAPGAGMSITSITSFGEDAAGEIYICKRGSNSSNTGEVYKIVPAVVNGAGSTAGNPLLQLGPPSPNPGTGEVSFSVALPFTRRASIRVFALDGRLVRTVLDTTVSAGTHGLRWDGRDQSGRPVPAGNYWIRLEAAGERRVRAVTVLR